MNKRSTGIRKVMGSIPVGGLGKLLFRVIRLENASSLFSLYPSRHSIYHLYFKLKEVLYDLDIK